MGASSCYKWEFDQQHNKAKWVEFRYQKDKNFFFRLFVLFSTCGKHSKQFTLFFRRHHCSFCGKLCAISGHFHMNPDAIDNVRYIFWAFCLLTVP